MKKISYFHLILYLFTIALALEVMVLARQNHLLKKTIRSLQTIEPPETLKEGDVIPSLTGINLDNRQVHLDFTNQDKKTVFFLFGTDCPHCLKMIPAWRAIMKEGSASKIRIYGVTMNPQTVVKNYVDGYQINYPVIVVDEKTYREYFKSLLIPQTLLIDRDGRIEKIAVGTLGEAEVNEFESFIKYE